MSGGVLRFRTFFDGNFHNIQLLDEKQNSGGFAKTCRM